MDLSNVPTGDILRELNNRGLLKRVAIRKYISNQEIQESNCNVIDICKKVILSEIGGVAADSIEFVEQEREDYHLIDAHLYTLAIDNNTRHWR